MKGFSSTVNIHNFGLLELNDIPIGFTVDKGTMIMEIVSGPIYYDDNYEYTFTATADLSEYGPHIIEVCTFLDEDENQDNDCKEKSVFNNMDNPNQIYNLSAGYQFISSAIIPPDPDMIEVMTDILNENLDFVRNSQGQTLRKIGPNWINGIGDWIIEEGYLVKMFDEDSFTIEGDLVNPSTPIALFEGFQLVSYLPLVQIDALEALGSVIGENLEFIRNSQGQTLRKIGPNWVNGIGNCIPKQGYLIKMINEDELIYPSSSCGFPFADSRDGQLYNTVQIGDQCWMAENLNIGDRIDGVQTMSNNGIIEKYCYVDDSINCEIYGGLYQWNEMMEYSTIQGTKGICPEGWHLPTDAEWFEMENYLDPSINDPNVTGWRGIDCGEQLLEGGTSGFEVLLGGQRKWDTGEFLFIGSRSHFWTSTINPYNTIHSWFRRHDLDNPQSYRNGASKDFGISVRCKRDETRISKKDVTLVLDEKKIDKPLSIQSHFLFRGGNPADPVYTIYFDGLNIGDEIAVYDGEILVGSGVLKSENIYQNEIPVFSNLYKAGNKQFIKIWNKVENKEYILQNVTFSNPYGDAWTENVFPAKDGEYSLLHLSKTGVSNEKELNEIISIFPNPSDGLFKILIESLNENIKVKVSDIHGNNYRFFEIEGNSKLAIQQLDLKELVAGVYFISFYGKDFSHVKKIVIQ